MKRKDKSIDDTRKEDKEFVSASPVLINHGRPLPPEATRWQKGVSGNPRGRPKKIDTITSLVETILGQTCETDVERRTWGRLAVKALLHAAIKGNSMACKLIWERYDGKQKRHAGKITWTDLTPEERANWSKQMLRRLDAVYGLDEPNLPSASENTEANSLEDEELLKEGL